MQTFLVVVGVMLALAVLAMSVLCIRKIQPGRAGVKTGWGGVNVAFDWLIRVPLVQAYHVVDISVKKLEITRKGKDGLVCKDNIRADITVAFYIRVEATVDFLIADRILQPVGEWLGEILDPEGDGVLLVLSYDASDLPGLSYESYQRYVGFIYSLARVKGAPAGSIRLSYEKADQVVRDNPVASYGGVLRMVPRCDF